MNPPQTSIFSLAVLAGISFVIPAFAVVTTTDSFGSGANAFTMDFVTVGNPGNAADTTGAPNPAGSVAYTYRMGTYEVSRGMVTKANAGGGLGITLADMTSFGGNGANKPATSVSWNEAARFVNFLNLSSGSNAAYKFSTQPGDVGYVANVSITPWVPGDVGYDSANPFRNSRAMYFLPSEQEWYKAAYYSSTGTYYDYATGSDTIPTAVASGTEGAVYNGQAGPADITSAGGLSPYGTMGQGGNALEWMETEFDGVNDLSGPLRVGRGGAWVDLYPGPSGFDLRASTRYDGGSAAENLGIGFRVASIPEPTSVLMTILAGSVIFGRRKR